MNMRKTRQLLLGPCKACHRKGFGFSYIGLGQYDWDYFIFLIFSALLSVLEKLKQPHADNMLTLYCASRNEESVQANLQWGKNVDIFNIFGTAFNCFQNCLQVTVHHCGHNPLWPMLLVTWVPFYSHWEKEDHHGATQLRAWDSGEWASNELFSLPLAHESFSISRRKSACGFRQLKDGLILMLCQLCHPSRKRRC